MPPEMTDAAALVAGLEAFLPFLCGAIAAAALALLGAAALPRRAAPARAHGGAPGESAFLFEGERLIDANAAGRDAIARGGGAASRAAVLEALAATYPELAARAGGPDGEGTVPDREGGRRPARFEREGARLRLWVPAPEGGARRAAGRPGATLSVDPAIFAEMEDELGALRTAVDAIPAPVWRTDPNGGVAWANAAYLARAGGDPSAWPPAPLFDAAEMADLPPPDSPRRLRAGPDGGWFDVSRPLEDAPLHCALPADEAVAAEASLRGFAMALTDTFAHLPIGLAVFDAGDRLKLFNPALADLTEIPAGLLAARPTLRDILDRMRESRLLAEPGDWHAWKDRIARLESDSRSGTYLEIWDMEGGRSWRVAGRPHPGGATALLIEDVSSELMLARRFKAEIRTGRALADAMPEAIAVFGREGVLLTSNAAYAAMWGGDPRAELREVTIADACGIWMRGAGPSAVWGDLRDAVTGAGPDAGAGAGGRAEWSARIEGGPEPLACRCVPLPDGATLVGLPRRGRGAGPARRDPRPAAARPPAPAHRGGVSGPHRPPGPLPAHRRPGHTAPWTRS